MAAGEILSDLRMTPLAATSSGTQQQFAFKDSGLLFMANRSGGAVNEIVITIVNLKTSSFILEPINLPNASQFVGSSILFSIQVAPTSTGFALIYIEDETGANRRLRFAHILDNGTVNVQPKNVLGDVTAQFNTVTHLRANNAKTLLGILFTTEVTQGGDPRLFRGGEIDLNGNFTAGPFILDQTMGGTAQVLNLQNPRLAADFDDSGWGVFWGSNQGGGQPGGFWFLHFLSGGAIDISKTQVLDSGSQENNLHDVVATTGGFAALIKRETGGDTAFYVRIDANGTNISTEINISEQVQIIDGQPFNPGFVSTRGGALKRNSTNGGSHLITQETVLSISNFQFLPSDIDDTMDIVTLAGLFGPFTTTSVNFGNAGGSLPAPLTTQQGFWIISNENTGNDDNFYIYTDFIDAILDQNRVDIADSGSGNHEVIQNTSFSFYAYLDIAENGTIRNGPHKVFRIPQVTSFNSQILQLTPIDDDNILITWLHTDESTSVQTFKSVILDRLTGNLNTQFDLPISSLPGTESGRDFGGVLLDDGSGVAFRFHLLGSSTANPNFLTIIDGLKVFEHITDVGSTNLVVDNLETSA